MCYLSLRVLRWEWWRGGGYREGTTGSERSCCEYKRCPQPDWEPQRKTSRELLYVCMHTVLVCSMLLTVNLPNKSGKYTLNGVKIREVEPFAVVSTYEKIDSAGLTDSTRYRTSLHNF